MLTLELLKKEMAICMLQQKLGKEVIYSYTIFILYCLGSMREGREEIEEIEKRESSTERERESSRERERKSSRERERARESSREREL